MTCLSRWLSFTVAVFLTLSSIQNAWAQALSTGEVTVQLIQGLDSIANPHGISQGKVTKSTNPAIALGSTAAMGIVSDAANGGFTVRLLRLVINGQLTPVASSDVSLAPDLFNKMQEKTRLKGQPQDSVTGPHIFLPEKMIVRFTLTTPPAAIAPSQRAAQPLQSPVKPKEWVTDTLPEVSDAGADVKQKAAILEGNVSYHGQTSTAYLVMHCDFPTASFPGLLPLETILGVNPDTLSAPGMPGAPVDVSQLSQSQLGTAPPIHVSATGQNRSTGGRIRFFYDAADMQAIVEGVGQNLRLSLGDGESPDTQARFLLPANNAPVKEAMAVCLQKGVGAAQRRQAAVVASCPIKPGEVLSNMSIQYADTGKLIYGDQDEETESAMWKLPVPVKGHVPRKISLTCLYKKAGEAGTPAKPDKEVVIVPPTARSCIFDVQATESRTSATCSSTPLRTPK